jgi:segregation and condensation protein B
MSEMNQEIKLSQKIEAILFVKGEPISIKKLAELCDATGEEVFRALSDLEAVLAGRGLTLARKGEEVMLGTNPELGPLLENIRKEELSKDLSKASLETLAIVLYKEGATRGDIDYIRGVNSSFILRNLLVRGLVEKATDHSDSRRYLYKPTFEALNFLGVSSLADLPDFAGMKNILDKNAQEANTENDQI